MDVVSEGFSKPLVNSNDDLFKLKEENKYLKQELKETQEYADELAEELNNKEDDFIDMINECIDGQRMANGN
jgi:hypothetical protein